MIDLWLNPPHSEEFHATRTYMRRMNHVGFYHWGRSCCTKCSQNSGIAWMGGGEAWIFLRICSHALRDLEGDHSSPKRDIYPQKCSFSPKIDHSTLLSNYFAHVIISPQKFSFSPRIDHSTFSLSNKFAHSCWKMSPVAVTCHYEPNCLGCLDWGVGGQPNSSNA